MDNNYDYANGVNSTQSNESDFSNPYGYSQPQKAVPVQSSYAVSESTPVPNYSNPYVQPQYTPNDFQSGNTKKKKSGKKLGLSIAAICAALLVAGGSFYAGIRYVADSGDSEITQAGASNNAVVANAGTITISDNNDEISSTITEVVENSMPSMVSISTISEETMGGVYGYFYSYIFGDDYDPTYQTSASGSGIIIGQNEEELLIVTNNHVIDGADEIAAEFIDGESYDATVKGTAADNDLAVISVKLSDISADTLSKIKVATLGNSDTLKLGEPAIAIGNALGYGQSVTVGYISAKARPVQLTDKTLELLQTDAAINPGNSGGALLNIKGEVIGINSAKYSDTSVEGMGYAIPITDAMPIIEELMTSTYVSDEEKPYLGIYGQDVPESYKTRFDWPEGVYVTQINPESPAALAGLKAGDIITAIDDTEISTMEELQEIISGHNVGDKVTLSVTRIDKGRTQTGTLTATLIARGDAEEN